MYYKYRRLDNLEFALDILVNHRLWASEFTKLNDPMEGLFTYGNEVPEWITNAIQQLRPAGWRPGGTARSAGNHTGALLRL